MKNTLLPFLGLSLLLIGCASSGDSDDKNTYYVHQNITSTVFWVGEEANEDNGNISNLESVWDDIWTAHYGGEDTPDKRDGYYPEAFIPKENPFYFALPFSDFDEDGKKKSDLTQYIPWAKKTDTPVRSVCKNRWIKVTKGEKTVYAQWEDAGPFGEDDTAYVFGKALPKSEENENAGLDLSPAVRDYLSLKDIDHVDWVFVDAKNVPSGPWKERLTTRNVFWEGSWFRPDVNASWQWQLQDDINTSYEVTLYDIDLFDSNTTLIDALKDEGKKVICYFSAGSYEEWRDDADDFPDEVLGNELDDWEGEKWLDISNPLLEKIMKKRLDLAEEKGCDGVEPDNIDGYTNDTGFNLTAQHQLNYNAFLANQAHMRGLSIGLKNDLSQAHQLETYFDFSLNEQCHQYEECSLLAPFTFQSKPIFNAEYADKYVDNTDGARDTLCEDAKDADIRTLVLPMLLDDSLRFSCDD